MTNLCAKTTQSSFNSVSISFSKTSQPVAIVQVGIFLCIYVRYACGSLISWMASLIHPIIATMYIKYP